MLLLWLLHLFLGLEARDETIFQIHAANLTKLGLKEKCQPISNQSWMLITDSLPHHQQGGLRLLGIPKVAS